MQSLFFTVGVDRGDIFPLVTLLLNVAKWPSVVHFSPPCDTDLVESRTTSRTFWCGHTFVFSIAFLRVGADSLLWLHLLVVPVDLIPGVYWDRHHPCLLLVIIRLTPEIFRNQP